MNLISHSLNLCEKIISMSPEQATYDTVRLNNVNFLNKLTLNKRQSHFSLNWLLYRNVHVGFMMMHDECMFSQRKGSVNQNLDSFYLRRVLSFQDNLLTPCKSVFLSKALWFFDRIVYDNYFGTITGTLALLKSRKYDDTHFSIVSEQVSRYTPYLMLFMILNIVDSTESRRPNNFLKEHFSIILSKTKNLHGVMMITLFTK